MVHEAHLQHARPARRRVRHAGLLLGAGAAAIVDDALLRRVAGWHEFHTLAGWEPLFALGGLILLIAGLVILHRARMRLLEPASGKVLVGSGFLGAALFIVLEGLATHHLLALHHVGPDGNALGWDASWLGVGILLALVGWRWMIVATRVRVTGSARRELKRVHERA